MRNSHSHPILFTEAGRVYRMMTCLGWKSQYTCMPPPETQDTYASGVRVNYLLTHLCFDFHGSPLPYVITFSNGGRTATLRAMKDNPCYSVFWQTVDVWRMYGWTSFCFFKLVFSFFLEYILAIYVYPSMYKYKVAHSAFFALSFFWVFQ